MANDRPDAVMTLDNIQRAYGAYMPVSKASANTPFLICEAFPSDVGVAAMKAGQTTRETLCGGIVAALHGVCVVIIAVLTTRYFIHNQ